MRNKINLLKLETQLLRVQAIFAEMKADNYQRERQGYSMAYDNFNEIIDECDKILTELGG